MDKNLRRIKEKGITLIALVITIIVLLILAGVTLSIAIDNGGLIGRAREAKTTWQRAETNETELLNYYSDYIDDIDQIKFTLKGVVYTAKEGQTWYDWVNSEYYTKIEIGPAAYKTDFKELVEYVKENRPNGDIIYSSYVYGAPSLNITTGVLSDEENHVQLWNTKICNNGRYLFDLYN